MKRYVDIQRLKDKYAMAFKEGEHIVCQEKLDGSNGQILFDAETGTLKAFSRRNELNQNNTLQGFYDFVQALDASIVSAALTSRYILFGEWLCLSGDTIIKKVSAGKGKKEMTLKEMYEYAHTPQDGRAKSWWERRGYPSLYSLNLETDTIESNKMQEIVYTGKKKVYKLTTHKGYSIKATANHPFLTPKGWVELGKLSEYDCVAITDFITRNIHQRTYGVGTRELFRKQKEYKNRIGKCEICGATNGLNLHHRDENPFHNTEDNWQVLCQDCHGKSHTKFNNQPKFDYEFDYIISIEDVGEEDCYDICMSGNENIANFIANNFIVHNCKHTIVYPESRLKQFYVFDVWDTEIEQYLPWEQTKQMAEFCGLKMVPLFYDGPFTSWEDIYKFVGKTEMEGSPTGEGIVVKSQDRLDNKSSRTPAYVKIVAKEFSEVHQSKPQKEIDPEKLAKKQADEALAATIVTERRVKKTLEKLIEDGIIPEDWDEKSLGVIAKHLPRAIYNDCVKEEPETVAQIENFGKICGSLTMKLAREAVK